MTGVIKVNELQGRSTANDITVTVGASATQSLRKGLVAAYINVDQRSTQSIKDSFNVASIADNGTGLTGVTYTNNMSVATHTVTLSDNGYTFGGSAGGINSNFNYAVAAQQQLTSRHGIDARAQTNTVTDKDNASTIVAGDLA